MAPYCFYIMHNYISLVFSPLWLMFTKLSRKFCNFLAITFVLFTYWRSFLWPQRVQNIGLFCIFFLFYAIPRISFNEIMKFLQTLLSCGNCFEKHLKNKCRVVPMVYCCLPLWVGPPMFLFTQDIPALNVFSLD